ncbi:MAG: antibiotic biosynthesis monooxygenase [Bacteroidetes bacterium 43-16]|nr:MAG: antibiotic biosynthesis monooxygenase [Bacteroidetes bacterium 43-16]
MIFTSCGNNQQNQSNFTTDKMMVRIAELEIEPGNIDEYISILKEEAEASVRLEPGVISIYPMFDIKNPTQIRILEIYANEQAYNSHLQTLHFKRYKTATENMIKSLKLIDMTAIDGQTMPQIFKKLSQ